MNINFGIRLKRVKGSVFERASKSGHFFCPVPVLGRHPQFNDQRVSQCQYKCFFIDYYVK